MADWITIDGATGEGGGQILRTSLALSLVTGRPVRIENIRAGRQKPGLLRQHLTAVQAAAAICRAGISGCALGSRALTFEPGAVRGGDYTFPVGTAGSTTLVLQTILPVLLLAPERSRVTLEGGTHNAFAPPFDFLTKAFLPLIRRMGARVDARLDAYGFYPAGGGRLIVDVEPCARLGPLELSERGPVHVFAKVLLSALPESIGKRELGTVRARLGLDRAMSMIEAVESAGPGNVLLISIDSESISEVVTGFGAKGVSAETVAADACTEAEEYLRADVPVGRYLADQLLLPLAIGSGGSFRTVKPTDHTITNAGIIRQWLDVPIAIAQESADAYRITVSTKSPETQS